MSLVQLEIVDRVATLTLDNPAERNTMTAPMVEEIVNALERIEADDGVGALVVTGAPPAFWFFHMIALCGPSSTRSSS